MAKCGPNEGHPTLLLWRVDRLCYSTWLGSVCARETTPAIDVLLQRRTLHPVISAVPGAAILPTLTTRGRLRLRDWSGLRVRPRKPTRFGNILDVHKEAARRLGG
jgi:hypothetical protein